MCTRDAHLCPNSNQHLPEKDYHIYVETSVITFIKSSCTQRYLHQIFEKQYDETVSMIPVSVHVYTFNID